MILLAAVAAIAVVAGAFQLGVWYERDQHTELNVEDLYQGDRR